MADFKKQGGSLTGREERYDGFEGEPRAVGSSLGGGALGSSTGHTGHHDSHNAGPHGSSMGNKMDPRVDSDLDGKRGVEGPGSGHNQYGSNTGSGTTGGYGSGTTDSGLHDSHNTAGTKKPSMMDKLNPMKDSDHDGKKGFME